MSDTMRLGVTSPTTLTLRDGTWALERLAGVTADPTVALPHARLVTGSGEIEDASWDKPRFDDWRMTRRTTNGSGLALESSWCENASVIVRRDRLVHRGNAPQAVRHLSVTTHLIGGPWEAYVQASSWAAESQGRWQAVEGAALELGHAPGRRCNGNTPFVAVRPRGGGPGFALHLVSNGDWRIRLTARPSGRLEIEVGLAAISLDIPLAPGATLALPEMLFVSLPGGTVEEGAPIIQRHLLNRWGRPRQATPLVWNTWLDRTEVLEPARLRLQLAAAVEVGCEALVVDAGWFGRSPGGWFGRVGDWREALDSAFAGDMAAFADEVRAAGLGFGLWLEPERVSPGTPFAIEHPELVAPGGRVRLEIPAAVAWLHGEVERLIAAYQPMWFKFDCNADFPGDPTANTAHHAALHGLLDRLRRDHPGITWEACAGGGQRLDVAMLDHADVHFLSDNACPPVALAILCGTLLRMPPGRITTWLTVRPDGSSDGVLVPRLHGYGDGALGMELVDAALPMLAGAMALSGDIAGLSPVARNRLARVVACAKHWRPVIADAVAHLLTPVRLIGEWHGWTILQLVDSTGLRSLILAQLAGAPAPAPRVHLHGLDAQRQYRIRPALSDEIDGPIVAGAELMRDGLEIAGPKTWMGWNSSVMLAVEALG